MRARNVTALAAAAVMLMAIIANVRKAADVMLNLGRPGTVLQSWDAILAAIALEAGFALFAFFLASELRGRRQYLRMLFFGTVIMGSLSAVANIAYYTRYSPAPVLTWEWWQSVIIGLSAPTVAIMTAILAGIVETIRETAVQEQVSAEQDQMSHELQIAKEQTAQARARAREAKARSGKIPESSGKMPADTGTIRMTPERLLAEYPEAAGWTGQQIANIAGVSPRTGRNWLHKMKALAGDDGRRAPASPEAATERRREWSEER